MREKLMIFYPHYELKEQLENKTVKMRGTIRNPDIVFNLDC